MHFPEHLNALDFDPFEYVSVVSLMCESMYC